LQLDGLEGVYCIKKKIRSFFSANVKATEKHVIGKLTTTTNFINTMKPVTTEHTTKTKFFSSTNVVSLLQNNMTSSKIEKVTAAPARHFTTREQYFLKKNISRQLSEGKNDMLTTTLSAHAYTYSSTIKSEVLTHDRENIVQNTTLENDSYIYAVETFTTNFDGKSETTGEMGNQKEI
jgi:hypothetical protein